MNNDGLDAGGSGGNHGGSGTWLLRCICDETRFAMLEMLQKEKEMCVGDFVSHLQRDQPLISHHLKRLKECGILTSRQDGKKAMYRISNPRLAGLIADIADAGRQIPNLCGSSSSGGVGMDSDGRACGC